MAQRLGRAAVQAAPLPVVTPAVERAPLASEGGAVEWPGKRARPAWHPHLAGTAGWLWGWSTVMLEHRQPRHTAGGLPVI